MNEQNQSNAGSTQQNTEVQPGLQTYTPPANLNNNTVSTAATAQKKSNGGMIAVIVLLVLAIPLIFVVLIFWIIGHTATTIVKEVTDAPTYYSNTSEPDLPGDDTANLIVAGTWDCYPFGGNGPAKENGYDSTLKLGNFGDFVYGQYGREDKDYYKGLYEAKDLQKTNGNGAYKYYSLEFNTSEFSMDGQIDYDRELANAEVGITGENGSREMILYFASSENMYYCYERSK